MKFIVDAHLPIKLAHHLREVGYDVVHTSELPLGNKTRDGDLNDLSIKEERILITKDTEFVDSLIISQKPYKLLLITTGNIGNKDLIVIFTAHLDQFNEAFGPHDFVELSREQFIIHW